MTRSLFKSGFTLSLLTLCSRVLGLLREMTKAALLGTTALSDAFSVAFLIPNLFRRLFAEGSISVAFIPIFKTYLIDAENAKTQADREETSIATKEFLSSIWTVISFFVSLVVGIGILCAPIIVKLFGMEEFDETVLLTRIMFPFLAFISIAAFFQGILNSVYVFLPSGMAPIILNIVTIACAWLLSPYMKNPARAMAIGILIGGFLEAAIQFPAVFKHLHLAAQGQSKRKIIFKWRGLKGALQNRGTKNVLKLIGPTIIGMAAYQLNDLVSTALASNAGEGIVSSLQYSLRLQELILGIFAVSIGTVLLPELAEHAKTANWKMYNLRLTNSIDIITLITVPVTFFSLVCGEEIVRLLFQSRLFDDQSVLLTKNVFIFHSLGIFFIALNRILAPAFYAQNDSVSPTIAGIVSFAINILLATLLVKYFRGSGIAFALSVSAAINTIVLFYFLKRKTSYRTQFVGSKLQSSESQLQEDRQLKSESKLKDEGQALALMLLPRFLYLIKIIIFSCTAIAPLFLFKGTVITFFKNINAVNKLIYIVLPLIIFLFVFLIITYILLLITKDENIKFLKSIVKRKGR
ncbi:MAG: murein biosynthesis integral membrane protein MurJ [Termitinemataceae bacterium]|nr:MAG: murein biosynthesis integral membrane protein MurJ [Termitinemataceae bacterium]